MNTYRIWFSEDTACLVDARSEQEARTLATAMYPNYPIVRVEQLD